MLRSSLRISLLLLALVMGCAWAADPITGYHYTGTIGVYPVQMDLEIIGTAATGTYWYERTGQAAPPWWDTSLVLSGKVSDKGEATFTETSRDVVNGESHDTNTGAFQGTFSNDRRTFAGKWAALKAGAPSTATSLPVSLTAVAEYRNISTVQGKFNVTGSYPYFLAEGAVWRTLSQRLFALAEGANKRFVAANLADANDPEQNTMTESYDVRVAYYSPTLISLRCDLYWDTGGAHGNTEYEAYSYAVTGDTLQELSLTTLFDAKTDFRKVLFDRTFADLKRQEQERRPTEKVADPWIEDTGEHLLPCWELSPTGITFIYARYDAYAYSEGDFFITIPYTDLKPYIRRDGPLAQFVK